MIQALDAPNIYAVPLDYHAQGLDAEVLDVFGIRDAPGAGPVALGARSPTA